MDKAEETPVVLEAEGAPAPVEVPAPAVEEPAPVVTATEAAPEVKEEVKEEVEAAKVEAITEGLLEFKPHGLLHFTTTRRFFYLQDEPVEVDNLQTYLKKEKKEKPEAAHSTAAYASQTGKGLLFFAKTEAQKAHPIGIIKLADVVDVTSSGTNKFALKLTNDVWNFESKTHAERNSWVHTIKAKVTEAKESVEAITSSDGYKATLEKFSKKSVAVKAEASKEKEKEKDEEKKEEKKEEEEKEEKEEGKKDEEKEEKKEKEKKDKKKEKKDKKKEEGAKSDDSSDSSSSEDEGSSDRKGKKRRSNSVKGKRPFYFGILGHKDKRHEKEEKVGEKKEEETKTEEPKAEVIAESSTEAPVVAATEEEKPAEEIKPVEETAKAVESPAAAEEVATPKGNKRHSFFGFFDKKKEAEKKEVEAVKERDAVSDTPPVIAPIGEESKEVVAEGSRPVDAATPAPVIEAGTKAPSSPPKESFFDKIALFKSKDKSSETEIKKEEVAETKPEEAEAMKEGEALKESEEKVAETSSPKDAKRRSSFFSLGKRDKKSSDVKSDTEEEPSTSKSNPASPLPKKLSLFRKNSKSAKDAPKIEPEEVPPVPEVAPPVVESQTPATTEAPAPVEETPVVAETTTTTAPATTA